MQNTPSMPLLPAPLWPGMVAPDWILWRGQIELNCNYAKVNYLKLRVVFNKFPDFYVQEFKTVGDS